MNKVRKDVIKKILYFYTTYKHSKDVENEVKRWLGSSVNESEKEEMLWQMWNDIDPGHDRAAHKSLREIKRDIGHTRDPLTTKLWRRPAFKIAAVLVPLLFASGLLFITTGDMPAMPSDDSMSTRTVLTTDSLKKEIVLYEGTSIVLNEKSMLAYNNDRQTSLTGEAYFKVKKNEMIPFVVKTERLTVTVLGTRFNVLAEEDSGVTVITLYEGNLLVSINDSQIYLSPGRELMFDHATEEVRINDIYDLRPMWTNDNIGFYYSSLTDILGWVEERYGVNIEVENGELQNQKITLKLRGEEKLEDVLFLLSNISGNFNYSVRGNSVKLKIAE